MSTREYRAVSRVVRPRAIVQHARIGDSGGGGGGGSVSSVFGRSGAVTAQSGDYASYYDASGAAAAALASAEAYADGAAADAVVGLLSAAVAAATYQPHDADLTALAALTGTGWARRTGVDTWTLATPSASDVGAQPLDSTLTSLALLGTAADRYAYTTGVATWAEGTITEYGRSVLANAGTLAAGEVQLAAPVTESAQVLTDCLSFPTVSGGVYYASWFLRWDTAATTTGLTHTAVCTGGTGTHYSVSPSTASAVVTRNGVLGTTVVGTGVGSGVANNPARGEAIFTSAGNDFRVQVASEISGSQITVQQGFLAWRRLS